MLFGYARISTVGQNLESQVDVLLSYGVEKKNIFTDIDSGAKTDRKELEKLLMVLRTGDEVVFYDLTRLGRDLRHLITIVDGFHLKGVNFKDLTNPFIDTKSTRTAEGELIFHVFAALGQFYRKSSNEKVKRGIEYARKEGRVGGRPVGLTDRLIKKAPVVKKLYLSTDLSIKELSKTLQIAPGSVYRCLDYLDVPLKKRKTRGLKKAS